MAESDVERDSRTEDATPRRRQEAREKGQVAFSVELLAALVLIGWLGAFSFAGDHLARALAEALAGGLSRVGDLGRGDFTIESSTALITALAPAIGRAALIVIVDRKSVV